MSTNDPSGPKRWLDDDEAAGQARRALLREGSELRPWPQARQEAAWREVERRAARPRRAWLGLAVAAPALAALLVVVGLGLKHPRRISVEGLGTVALGPGAQVTRTPTREQPLLQLAAGTVEARIQHRPEGPPFVIQTPHARIVDVGTRFTVEVQPGFTRVTVSEGRVQMEANGGSMLVTAGESLRSDDARLHPPPPPASAPHPDEGPRLDRSSVSVPACSSLASPAERDACDARVAQGSGLDAENALVSQALERRDRGELTGAIDALRTYQARFPAGLFAPEVAFELVHELADAGKFADAARAAEQVEAAYPQDPRTPELRLRHARVLREDLREPARAAALAEPLASASSDRVREAALYELGLDLDAAGRTAEAEATWKRYLDAFPDGPHAGAARARLGR